MYLKGAINADSILTFSGGETRDTPSQQEPGSAGDVLIVLLIKGPDQPPPRHPDQHTPTGICTKGRLFFLRPAKKHRRSHTHDTSGDKLPLLLELSCRYLLSPGRPRGLCAVRVCVLLTVGSFIRALVWSGALQAALSCIDSPACSLITPSLCS